MIHRAYYDDTIDAFLDRAPEEVVGLLATRSEFRIESTQRDAWLEQIAILREALGSYRGEGGKVYFEFNVPRVGKRIDVVAVIRHVLFVIEFKVGESVFGAGALDQVWDYALDLKNFHETSHVCTVAPILVATRAASVPIIVATTAHGDGLMRPIPAAAADLGAAIAQALAFHDDPAPTIDAAMWECGRYSPTPTIVEAALALYGSHSVSDISRRDAGARNLTDTSDAVCRIIQSSRERREKAICFVTGVPGAGKTLVGLNIATKHFDKNSELYSVFLSGNGPLVA
ncbi:MAG TPA: DNA/RNA helicase domain-containing protein, partial [Salinarimonas sp.]|nr:DNA/RNA helicase domain-containing protein [Salinarimonas sp.]